MQIVIHQGGNQIGGNCIEVIAQGQRIVLDVGVPVDCQDRDTIELPNIAGFRSHDPSLLGVFLSHAHLDHYGLAHRLPPQTKFFMGRACQSILQVANIFSANNHPVPDSSYLEHGRTIKLGPFTVTPFLVDHSAYDSYALLVEADGRRLFYSGDFRCHGRKRRLVERLITNPPSDIDCVLMEGTNVERDQEAAPMDSESELENRFAQVFSEEQGMPLVWCSSQNLDRIVTIYRACKRANRQLILDVYTAELLRAVGNENLPQASWRDVRVFLPASQRRMIIQHEAYPVTHRLRSYRIYPEALESVAANSVMLFRPSMIRDLTNARLESISSVTCSLWRGYLDSDQSKALQCWLNQNDLPLHYIHTSGHASLTDLRRFRSAFPKARVVGIHTSSASSFASNLVGTEAFCNGTILTV